MIFRRSCRAGECLLRIHYIGRQQQSGYCVVPSTDLQQPGVFQHRYAVHPVRVYVGVSFQGYQQRTRNHRIRLELQTRVSTSVPRICAETKFGVFSLAGRVSELHYSAEYLFCRPYAHNSLVKS